MIMPIFTVQDVDASIAFYTEKLGFKQDFVMAGPEGKNVFGFVSLGKAVIGLDTSPGQPRGGAGADFMIYIPDDADLDKHYADVQAKGVKIAAPIEDKYWGDRTYAVHDPDGYRLTFAKFVKQVPMEEIQEIMRSGNIAQ